VKPGLEELLKALEALKEQDDGERAEELREIYEAKLSKALEQNPSVSEETLRRMIRIYYSALDPSVAQILRDATQGVIQAQSGWKVHLERVWKFQMHQSSPSSKSLEKSRTRRPTDLSFPLSVPPFSNFKFEISNCLPALPSL
jgi:hypothetical protein